VPGVAFVVVNVNVELTAPVVIVTGFELHPILTPEGRVEVVRFTDPVKPLLGVTVMLVEPPVALVCATETPVGFADTL
jgi:hypothetical protein